MTDIPDIRRQLPLGGSLSMGRNHPGAAKRTATSRQKAANTPIKTLPRTCGAVNCATTTPTAMPGPQLRRNAKSELPARQRASEETIDAGKIAASEVLTATWAA